MKHIIRTIMILVLLSLSLSACTLTKLNVGVTTYPIQYLVNRIAADKVNVFMYSKGQTMLRANIVDDYKEIMETTDVLFHFGKLEPYLTLYMNELQASSMQLVDLTNSAGVYEFARYTTTNLEMNRISFTSPYYVGEAFDMIDLYDTDPYLWLDPITMISMAGTIKDWLVQKFPEEKQFFISNYDLLKQELAFMDADYQELWKQDIAFVTVTPSFGNWQKAYGIRVYPLILSRYGALPTPSQLALIKERIKADEVKLIVHEPNLTEDMETLYNAIKTELELTSIELHTLTFLTEQDIRDNKDYKTIMFENLDVLEGLQP